MKTLRQISSFTAPIMLGIAGASMLLMVLASFIVYFPVCVVAIVLSACADEFAGKL